ncbi:MAG: ABC transporter substrate-binding protein, partial [Anaerolinea sp.]|nr:ABC transporter substrate-binding protein [Anaerolinea sp.]
MKRRIAFLTILMVLFGLLAACGGGQTTNTPASTTAPAPTAETAAPAPVEETPMAEGVSCAEPVKVGLITDETGALAIYGAHILRGFPLG